MAVRAGVYIRISKTKRELLDAQRQEPPCRAFCTDQSWTVDEIYIDDGRSAWKRGVTRDNFERMLADVRAGKLDAVVSWQMDRLLRRVEDASAILAIARQYGTSSPTLTVPWTWALPLAARSSTTWPWPPSTPATWPASG